MAKIVVYPGLFHGYNVLTARETARLHEPGGGRTKGKD